MINKKHPLGAVITIFYIVYYEASDNPAALIRQTLPGFET